MQLSEKTFILGVGAQKCGTSWLARYLRGHPNVAMSTPKELHYFDAIWRPDISGRPPEAVRNIIARGGHYFETLANQIGSDRSHFGEFTPAYSVLPKDGFAEIRKLHPRIRLIFLMRDPVDRFVSGLRHDLQRKRPTDFDTAIRSPRHVERTRYDRTVENLLANFSRRDVFFGFYETLFNDETTWALCRFLGINHVSGDYTRVINATQDRVEFSKVQIEHVRETFEPVYAFCRAEFKDRLPLEWRS